MKDFIGEYSDAVDLGLCDWLINFVDQSNFVTNHSDIHRKDKQICLDSFAPGESKALLSMVGNCLYRFIDDEVPFLNGYNMVSSTTLLQKTEPMEGYHSFHTENIGWNASNRTMAWMVYLNDVEEGGETEFLYQQKKFKPQKGTVLIWPSGITHFHRGNPPMTDKYIATGWFQADTGQFNEHIMSRNVKTEP